MMKFFCDRCGEEIELETFTYFENPADKSSLKMGLKSNLSIPLCNSDGDCEMKRYTLCKDCMKRITGFLQKHEFDEIAEATPGAGKQSESNRY